MKHAKHHDHTHAHALKPEDADRGMAQPDRWGVPSLLLASTAQRLCGACVLLAVLWLAVAWALNP